MVVVICGDLWYFDGSFNVEGMENYARYTLTSETRRHFLKTFIYYWSASAGDSANIVEAYISVN